MKSKKSWDAKYTLLLQGLVSLVLLGLIFYKLEPARIMETISLMPSWALPLFLLPSIFSTTLYALSSRYLIEALGERLSLLPVLKASFAAKALALVFPGQIGIFSFVPLLKKQGVPMGKSLAVVLADKMISFTIMMAFAAYGILFFFGYSSLWKSLLAFAVMALGFILAVRSSCCRQLVKRLILRKYSSHFQGFHQHLSLLWKGRRTGYALLLDACATVLWISFTAIVIKFLFLALGVKVGLPFIITIQSIASISTLLPISLSGAGVRESLTIFLYSRLGVEPLITGSIFLSFLLASYLISLVVLVVAAGNLRKNDLSMENPADEKMD